MSIEFSKPNFEELKSLIEKELKEVSFSDKIINRHGLEVNPVYTETKHSIQIPHSLDYRICFQYFGLDKSRPSETNETILKTLENGQNGLLLGFKDENWTEADISSLFKDIRLDYIHMEFVETNAETSTTIKNYLDSNYPDLDWSHCFFPNHFKYLAEENFIDNAAKLIREINTDKAFIYVELSGDYFWDISKIRAFKTLLFNHAKLEGISPNYILVGETTVRNKSKEDLKNNILKLTTEAMSGVIGGCEGIWIRPFNGDYLDEFSNRISRNIFHLMQEESYIQHVSDTSSGSYFIENYTEMIAKSIYSKLSN